MKKNYTSGLSFLRKAGKRAIIAAALAFGTGIGYGQILMDEDFSGQVLPIGWDTVNVLGNWSFDNPGGRSISGGDPGFDSDFAIFDSDDICSSGEEGTLESASFDASSATVAYILEFDNSFRSYSNATQEGHVDVWNGTSWTEVFTLPGGISDGFSTANHKTVDITAACGGSSAAKVRFRSVNGACNWWWAIDNVTVTTISCPVPSGLTATNITSGGADIGWTATLPAPANGYEYYYSTGSTPPTSTTIASGSVGVGVTTASLGSLSALNTYYVWVRSICSSTDTSDWSASLTFVTLPNVQIPATLPYSEDFTAGAADWTILNGAETNQWYIGAATGNTGNSLYITDDGGTTNAYSMGDISAVQAYRDIVLTPGSNPFSLKFDWKAKGEGTSTYYDYFRVWIVPHDYTPSPGTQVSSGPGRLQIGANFNDPNASAPAWHTENFQIPDSFAGDTVRLVFEWKNDGGGGSQPPAAIDNINVSEITCSAPTALTVDNIATTTADIAWTAPSSVPANGYEYYYNTTNIAPTGGTVATGSVGAGNVTAGLTGLNGLTTYYVWARSLCSTTDTSEWSASLTFTTLPTPQVPATLPYSDDFANTAADWTLLNGTQTNNWFIGGATGNTGNSLYVSNDGGTTNAYTVSPASAASVVQAYRDIELTPGVNPFMLLFDWKCIGEGTSTNYDYFRVWVVPHTYVPAPGTQISVTGSGGIQLGGNINDADAGTATWHSGNFIIPDSFAGDTIRLVFEWRNDVSFGSQPPAAIDNIYLTEITCSAPTALTLSNISGTSADISWTAPLTAPANGYQYYYSTNSAAPTSTTSPSGSVNAPLTTAALTSLTANTQYYVWLRSICSATDSSDWIGGITFTTLCDADAIPYIAPLASVTTPGVPSCMSTELINTLGTEWYTSNNPGSGFSGKTLVSTYTGSGDGDVDSWIYTNGLLLTGGLPYQLHYRYGNNSTTYAEKLEVKYGTAATVSSMTTLLTDHSNIDDGVPHDTVVTFTPAGTGIYYIGFHAYSDEDQFRLYLDSITVVLQPCDSAIALTASNVTSSGADLGWTGTAAQYTLEYGLAGFALGTGTSVSVVGNSYTLNSLDPNSSYDYYVRSVCTPGLDSSAYSVSATFTTLCDPVFVSLGNDTAFCSGNTVVLDAGMSSATFEWNDASTAQTLSVTTSGDYYVTVTDTNGCSGSDTISVTVHDLPVVDLGADTGICAGGLLTLDAGNAGSDYLWNDGSTQQTLDVDLAGDYAVVVTDANGCVATDTIMLMVNNLPIVDLGADTSICEGDTLMLNAGNSGSNYTWSDASTGQTISAFSTGDYWVSVINAGGCSASDTMHLEIRPAPSVDGIIVTDNGGGSYSFEAENPADVTGYEWDFGDGSPRSHNSGPTHTYPATGTDSITITLVVINECGSDSASVTIPGPGVGIQQVEPGKDKLKLYPNPARDLIIIQNESHFKMEEMTVYNVLGQVVFQTRLKDTSRYSLDVSAYAQGLYQVRIRMNGGFAIRKFEVIH